MRKTIWKFPLEVTDYPVVKMPPGKVLTVQTQGGQPCLWALVDPDGPVTERRFRVYGTGHAVKDRPSDSRQHRRADEYVGTFQLYDGQLVFHVFEELP